MSYLPPTANTQTATTGNPLQPNYLGAPPQVAPTTSNYQLSALTSNYAPNAATTNQDVSPSAALSQFQSANALTDAQQNANLNNILASEGISGNDAVAAQGALSGQQQAAQAPSLANLITNAQGLGLNQAQFNASSQNALNPLNLQQSIFNAESGNALNPLGLNQSEFNAGAGNTASLQNLASLMSTNAFNANAGNAAGTDLASLLQQNYGMDLNSIMGLLTGGLGGAQSINNAGTASLANLANQTANSQNQNTANGWNSLIGLGLGLGTGGAATAPMELSGLADVLG